MINDTNGKISSSPGKPERLQKLLSASGITSRRNAEKMIRDGRVLVNGITAEIGQTAMPGTDLITVDGKPLTGVEKLVYIMLNKPGGYLTTVKDDRGRRTVMELVSDINAVVYPVGRLDLNSEGLLLFTNDGEFANKVMHPSFNKQKIYEVSVRGDVESAVKRMRLPIEIDDYKIIANNIELTEKTTNGGKLLISINEGRNRQIRKMCAECGLNVDTLKRISIGRVLLGDLETGKWRHLTEEEVRSLG